MKKQYLIILFYFLLNILINNTYSQCFINGNLTRVGQKLNTTGSQTLDAKLSSESKILNDIFAVEVELYAYDDKNSHNAYASPVCDILNCDGSIRLGKSLLLDEIVVANGYVSVIGIMAHEYSHIVQFQQKSKLTGKSAELQADFLAGWYLGKTKNISFDDLKPFANSLYNKGDFNFWSTQHHGTPKERANAMIKGFVNSYLTLKDAYENYNELIKNNDTTTNTINSSNNSSTSFEEIKVKPIDKLTVNSSSSLPSPVDEIKAKGLNELDANGFVPILNDFVLKQENCMGYYACEFIKVTEISENKDFYKVEFQSGKVKGFVHKDLINKLNCFKY